MESAMDGSLALRLGLAACLALATAVFVHRAGQARGLEPPGFEVPWRRVAALTILTLFLWLGVLGPALSFDLQPEPEPPAHPSGLFGLSLLLFLTVVLWHSLAYGDGSQEAGRWVRHLGLIPREGWTRELGIGLAVGVASWMLVLVVAIAVAIVLTLLGQESALMGEDGGAPPEIIVWMASLPAIWRILVSLAAGLFEEVFFRGFLQRRVGIGLSTLLFVVAHLAYGEPFMLVGVTVLSLTYAVLAHWRRNVWAAVTAHAVFDGIQLLVVIPTVLRLMEIGVPVP